METVLFVKRITRDTFEIAKKHNVSVIVHEDEFDGPFPTDILSRKLNISLVDSLVTRYHSELVFRVEQYLKNEYNDVIRPFKWVKIPEDVLVKCLRGYLVNLIEEDYRLIVLADHFFRNAQKLFIFKNPDIACYFLTTEKILNRNRRNLWKNSKAFLPFVYLFFLLITRDKYNKSILVCDVPFSNFQNNHFSPLFHFFTKLSWKPVYFVQSKKSELADQLRERGNDIVGYMDLSVTFPIAIDFIKLYLRCIPKLIFKKRIPLSLKLGYLCIIARKLKAEALINSCKVDYFLKIMGDMDHFSSIDKFILNSHAIKTISFFHCSYYFLERLPISMEFDFYGFTGKHEFNIYKKFWDKEGIKFIHSGLFTIESPNDHDKISWEDINRPHTSNEPVIGIFPTSISHYDDVTIDMYIDFVDICFQCASKVTKTQIIFKDKYGIKVNRKDCIPDSDMIVSKRILMDSINTYDVDPVIVSFEKVTNISVELSTSDVFSLIDIGFSLSASTISFEMIALGKKCLVYDPYRSRNHPFYKYTPLLVASDLKTFETNFDHLINMSMDNYLSYIRPTIEYCAKDFHNHNIHDFFYQIDEALVA